MREAGFLLSGALESVGHGAVHLPIAHCVGYKYLRRSNFFYLMVRGQSTWKPCLYSVRLLVHIFVDEEAEKG